MEEILKELNGKTVDIACDNGAIYRGEVVEIIGGVVGIRDEEAKVLFIAIDKIVLVSEANNSTVRPGFIV